MQAPLERYIKALQAQAVKLAGVPFSLDSPKEVSQVLFEHLKLPVPPNTDLLKGGLPSTRSEVRQAPPDPCRCHGSGWESLANLAVMPAFDIPRPQHAKLSADGAQSPA